VKVEVRVIAATTRIWKRREFRPLSRTSRTRLNVIRIEIPAAAGAARRYSRKAAALSGLLRP